MSIRKTILLAFVGFGALVAALLTALAYTRSRAALSDEIRLNLQTQAVTVMEQIDALLFERVVDVNGWRGLDVMQEARVGDVDKRLARFFSEVHEAYAGTYTGLLFVTGGRVVAASDATVIGSTASKLVPQRSLPLAGTAITLQLPDAGDPVPVLTLRADVTDGFDGTVLGELRAEVDWSEVGEILTGVVGPSQRTALLLDGSGRILAQGGAVPRAIQEPLRALATGAGPDVRDGVLALNDWPVAGEHWMAGYALASRYKGLPDLGWRLLVLVPQDAAFAPVVRLLHTLLALLVVVFVIAVLLAVVISRRIAQPVVELTRLTRRMHLDGRFEPARIGGHSEVGELGAAFNRLLEDLNRSRDDLIRVSKLAAVGEMSAMLAHEVRNPLGVVRSSAQLLERQKGIDARGHEILALLLKECDRINELVTGLLESARPRPVAWAHVALGEVIYGVASGLGAHADKAGVKLELHVDQPTAELVCDRELLHRMLLNLGMNAIQMTPAGGSVRISANVGEDGASIQVDDSGRGIPETERERVLEPFYSRRAGGVGLGLAVVQNIVRQHAGTLSIGVSDLGGARFRVDLPPPLNREPG